MFELYLVIKVIIIKSMIFLNFFLNKMNDKRKQKKRTEGPSRSAHGKRAAAGSSGRELNAFRPAPHLRA
jgi:hypothetical protein